MMQLLIFRFSFVAKHARPQDHLSFLAGGDLARIEEKLALKTYRLIGQILGLRFALT